MTPSVTITATPSVTPTSSEPLPIVYYEVLPCCSSVSVNDDTDGYVLGVIFNGTITSLNIGDVFVWNYLNPGDPISWRVVGASSSENVPYFYLDDEDIFQGGVNNCFDAANAFDIYCQQYGYFTGCTTGNVYFLYDLNSVATIGFIPQYGESATYYFEGIQDELSVNGDCYLNFVPEPITNGWDDVTMLGPDLGQVLAYPLGCENCPSNTPTPTPSITPTFTPTITPTITPTPSVTPSPIPEAIQCGDFINISNSSFSEVLNPDGTIQSYPTSSTIINATLNLSSCAGTVKFSIYTQTIRDRIVVKNSSDEVVIDTLYIGTPNTESTVNNIVGDSPFESNVFTWNNNTEQLEFTNSESVEVTVTDFPIHSDSGNFTYPLYTNVWDDNGVSRYGAKGQIGGTLEYVNSVGSPVSPLSCYSPVGGVNTYAGCGGTLNQSRVFSFVKPQGESVYNLTIYGATWGGSPTEFRVTLLDCPSC